MQQILAPQSAWYLVHTKPRQETKALFNLEQQGYSCYLPLVRVEKMQSGKALVLTEPLFQRYLFIQLDCSGGGRSWTPIRSTPGVSTLVQFGERLATVDGALLQQLRAHNQSHPISALFNSGEMVRICNGPFAGLNAIYQCSDAKQRSLVLLEVLHKQLNMQIDTTMLGKIA